MAFTIKITLFSEVTPRSLIEVLRHPENPAASVIRLYESRDKVDSLQSQPGFPA